jgi:hypothetical protein
MIPDILSRARGPAEPNECEAGAPRRRYS